jgi:hypothetical protein
MAKKLTSLLVEKFESWPEPEKPPFTGIRTIGCCEQHEGDFAWYRSSTWQDFRDYILQNKFYSPENVLDPYQFHSLEPRAHRYYMKGALSALTAEVGQVDSFEILDGTVWSWIKHEEKELESFKQFKKEYSDYSKEEVGDIIELIELIKERLLIKGDKEQKEIINTIAYWKQWYDKL